MPTNKPHHADVTYNEDDSTSRDEYNARVALINMESYSFSTINPLDILIAAEEATISEFIAALN